MIFKTLSVILACNFVNNANAAYEIDGTEIEGTVSIPLSDPAKTYSLKSENRDKDEENYTTRLVLSDKQNQNGKFIEKSNLTFEEYCLLVKASTPCTNESRIYMYDSNVISIYYKGNDPLHISHYNNLRLDNCTIISENSEVIFHTNHMQGNFFVKTPKFISFMSSSEQKGGINELKMKPISFNFIATTGLSMSSSSAFISMDVNFGKQIFNLDMQCIGDLTISDRFPEENMPKSAPSSPRKKQNLAQYEEQNETSASSTVKMEPNSSNENSPNHPRKKVKTNPVTYTQQ